jgi:hypothetical protein
MEIYAFFQEVKQPERESNHLSPSYDMFKNALKTSWL